MKALLKAEYRYFSKPYFANAPVSMVLAIIFMFRTIGNDDVWSNHAERYGMLVLLSAMTTYWLLSQWANRLRLEKRPLLIQPLPLTKLQKQRFTFSLLLLFHLPTVITLAIYGWYMEATGLDLSFLFHVNLIFFTTGTMSLLFWIDSLLLPWRGIENMIIVILGTVLFFVPVMIFMDVLLSRWAIIASNPLLTITGVLVFFRTTWAYAGRFSGLETLSVQSNAEHKHAGIVCGD